MSRDLLFVSDFDGRWTDVSPSVRALLGYTPEQFLALALYKVVHAEDLEKTLGCIHQAAGGFPTSVEVRCLHKNGSTIWMQWMFNTVVENEFALTIARDISKQKMAELKLQELTNKKAAA